MTSNREWGNMTELTTWTTPLVAMMSACVISAPSTIVFSPDVVTSMGAPCIDESEPVTAAAFVSDPSTWYNRICARSARSSKPATSSSPRAAAAATNAASVGAKTVNFLSVASRVAVKFALVSAATKWVNSSAVSAAVCTTFFVGVDPAGISNTVPMTWTTPFPACMFAVAAGTATPLTVRSSPVLTRSRVEPSTEAGVDVVASASITSLGTTWYFNNAAKASLSAFSSSMVLLTFVRYASKAALVGAKTVKGPAPVRVVARSAATTASTNLEKSLLPLATSTTLGINTEGIWWITPFPARTSEPTVTPSTVTVLPSFTKLNLPASPYSVACSPVVTSAAITFPARMWYFTMFASSPSAKRASESIPRAVRYAVKASLVGANTVCKAPPFCRPSPVFTSARPAVSRAATRVEKRSVASLATWYTGLGSKIRSVHTCTACSSLPLVPTSAEELMVTPAALEPTTLVTGVASEETVTVAVIPCTVVMSPAVNGLTFSVVDSTWYFRISPRSARSSRVAASAAAIPSSGKAAVNAASVGATMVKGPFASASASFTAVTLFKALSRVAWSAEPSMCVKTALCAADSGRKTPATASTRMTAAIERLGIQVSN
mmetsp:Transcript_14016/g.35308  ORF Transcript_14016/g.35308 Transcript_14016/m.35308 type:complete len:607 (-) Transcript_14016:49-1869(-)